ncbi:hypothetical protein NL676_010901 [Syzygium grande]|nr:hypothetical protein NL676_010901 [Syzygium grande]
MAARSFTATDEGRLWLENKLVRITRKIVRYLQRSIRTRQRGASVAVKNEAVDAEYTFQEGTNSTTSSMLFFGFFGSDSKPFKTEHDEASLKETLEPVCWTFAGFLRLCLDCRWDSECAASSSWCRKIAGAVALLEGH